LTGKLLKIAQFMPSSFSTEDQLRHAVTQRQSLMINPTRFYRTDYLDWDPDQDWDPTSLPPEKAKAFYLDASAWRKGLPFLVPSQ
jgi:hypothetical protein